MKFMRHLRICGVHTDDTVGIWGCGGLIREVRLYISRDVEGGFSYRILGVGSTGEGTRGKLREYKGMMGITWLPPWTTPP